MTKVVGSTGGAMQRLILGLILLGILLVDSGCTTSYWQNRRDDIKDTVTLVFGKGRGVDAKVSLLKVGAIVNEEHVGLQGGKWHGEHHANNVNLLFTGSEVFANDVPDYDRERGKSDEFWNIGPICLPGTHWLGAEGIDRASKAANSLGRVELSVGLGASMKIGFNLLECLDFAGGLLGIDLLADDINGTVNAIVLYPDMVVLTRYGSDDQETVENSRIGERLRELLDTRGIRDEQFVLMPCYQSNLELRSKAPKGSSGPKDALSPEYTEDDIAQIKARQETLLHWFQSNRPVAVRPWGGSNYHDMFHHSVSNGGA